MATSTTNFFRLFFLSIFLLWSVGLSAQTERARVVSSGGGATISANGQFTHVGVLGEPLVSSAIGSNSFSGQIGFLYMTQSNEPHYVGQSDSLILVDMYNNLGGANWVRPWDLRTPVSTWQGVEVAYGSVLSVNLSNNNLRGVMPTSVINFSKINTPTFSINIGGNFLDFRSAENFVTTIPNFTYSPQAKLYAPIDTTLLQGESITFSAETGGVFNRYQWFKDGQAIAGQTNATLTITSVLPSDAGVYTCRVTNTQATDLTLTRHDIHLNVEGFVDPFDSLALVEIFQSTGGDSWINPWNLNDPVATWEGVLLGGQKVLELDLSSRNLRGVLPDVFDAALFTELRYLSFFDNQLEGQIPETIGNLTSLTYLDLDKNQFEGTVPASLGNLINLQALWLSRNNLETLPNEIGNLSSLRALYINQNKFASLPATLGNLTELLVLNISDNLLTDLPPTITNLRKLRELYAERNLIASLPDNMNNLIALAIFSVNTNRLEDLPSNLLQIQQLKTLRVSENKLEFDDLLPFANRNFDTFEYAPQAPINEETEILATFGSSVTLQVITQGSGNQYRWDKDRQTIGTTQNLTLTNVNGTNAGTYIAYVSNPALPQLTLQRRPITLNVECGQAFSIQINQPEQTVFCEGQSFGVQLRIQADIVGNARIRWRRNGVILAFANQATYTVTSAGRYTAEVLTAGGCTAVSNEVEITLVERPEVEISLIDNSVLTSTINLNEEVNYQWFKDGQPIENANQATYTPTSSGEYALLIQTSTGCTALSRSIIFTITSLEDEEPNVFKSLTLYPNPNGGSFYVDFGRIPSGIPIVRLIDAIGREVSCKAEEVSATRLYITTKDLAGGIYQLEIQTQDGIALRRFILEE